MNEAVLERAMRKTGKARPRVVVWPLKEQMPGPYLAEHDAIIQGTIDVFSLLKGKVSIYCSGGTPDCDGLTGGRYIATQIEVFALDRGHRNIADAIVIGEQVSSHTAEDIRISRQFLMGHDLIVLVSNWPHLLPAGVYLRHFIPEVPFVKWSLGSGRGCLDLPYGCGHWAFARLIDCPFFNGRFLDEHQARIAQSKRELRFPSVPYIQD